MNALWLWSNTLLYGNNSVNTIEGFFKEYALCAFSDRDVQYAESSIDFFAILVLILWLHSKLSRTFMWASWPFSGSNDRSESHFDFPLFVNYKIIVKISATSSIHLLIWLYFNCNPVVMQLMDLLSYLNKPSCAECANVRVSASKSSDSDVQDTLIGQHTKIYNVN